MSLAIGGPYEKIVNQPCKDRLFLFPSFTNLSCPPIEMAISSSSTSSFPRRLAFLFAFFGLAFVVSIVIMFTRFGGSRDASSSPSLRLSLDSSVSSGTGIYRFSVPDPRGEEQDLSLGEFAGFKATLIVNTASQ